MATEIKYNGSVIATPEVGQTATLKCNGMKMASDVVVEVTGSGGDADLLERYIDRSLTELNLPNAKLFGAFKCYSNNEITSVRMPQVSVIEDQAFSSAYVLNSVYTPRVTKISAKSFYNCWELKDLRFPALNQTSIPQDAFAQTPLQVLDAGGVGKIDNSVINKASLTTLILRGSGTTLSSVNYLSSTKIATGEGYIYVPKWAVNAYKNGTNWSSYADQVLTHEDNPDLCGVNNYSAVCTEDMSTTISTAVCSIDCEPGDLIVAAIMLRSQIMQFSEGWTILSTSEVNSSDNTGQFLVWAYKYAESERETLEVRHLYTGRLQINMIALKGATGVIDNGFQYQNTITGAGFAVTKPANGLTLMAVAASLWTTAAPYGAWKTDGVTTVIQPGAHLQSRLALILCHEKDTETVTITPAASSTIICGSLTVQGVDSFEPWRGL